MYYFIKNACKYTISTTIKTILIQMKNDKDVIKLQNDFALTK